MSGEKRYGFRKTIFRNGNTKKAYIYSTAPIKKVVGTFLIGDIVEDYPDQLWEKFHMVSGLTNKEFFNYFNKNRTGFAIQIESVEEFDIPVNPWEMNPNFIPPQSFYYFENPY